MIKKIILHPNHLKIIEKYGNGKQLTPEEYNILIDSGITKQNIKKLAYNKPEPIIR
jgi:hypothetical protein